MKTTYIFSPIVLGIVAMVWVSASGGVADIQNKDRTGSPVSDVACTQCHTAGANFSASALIQISNLAGATVTQYIPGETYSLKINMQSPGSTTHGFQVTGMLSDNSSAGSCSAVTSNTQISPLNGRWYFEPTTSVSGGEYEMNWTAPVAGSGSVTFYGSALAANGNGTTVGDQYVNIPNIILVEGVATSVLDVTADLEIKIFPNPAVDALQINSSFAIHRVEVLDMSGRKVLTKLVSGSQVQLNVSALVKGNYMVSVYGNQDEVTYKMIVKE
ncbi:MAG: hypothetical protein ACI85Q_001267 [Salibacteraceae bacterium]|jgi:hypothetical protein